MCRAPSATRNEPGEMLAWRNQQVPSLCTTERALRRGSEVGARRLRGCRQAGDGEGDTSQSRGLHNQHAAGTGWAGSGAAQRGALKKNKKIKKRACFFPAEQQPWRWESARGRGGRFSRQGRAALCPGSHPPACRICFGLSWASQHCCQPFRRGSSAFPALFPSDTRGKRHRGCCACCVLGLGSHGTACPTAVGFNSPPPMLCRSRRKCFSLPFSIF